MATLFVNRRARVVVARSSCTLRCDDLFNFGSSATYHYSRYRYVQPTAALQRALPRQGRLHDDRILKRPKRTPLRYPRTMPKAHTGALVRRDRRARQRGLAVRRDRRARQRGLANHRMRARLEPRRSQSDTTTRIYERRNLTFETGTLSISPERGSIQIDWGCVTRARSQMADDRLVCEHLSHAQAVDDGRRQGESNHEPDLAAC